MSIDLSQFHQVFFEESIEGLDLMESALMELDPDNVDSETINAIFRAAHSIKGGSATFGFTSVSEFTHELETILDQVRDGRRSINNDDVNVFLKSVDCMREMLASLQDGGDGRTDAADELHLVFKAMLDSSSATSIQSTPSQTDTRSVNTTTSGISTWRIFFKPGGEVLQTGNEPSRIFNALTEFGQLQTKADVSSIPSFQSLDAEKVFISWELRLQSESASEDDIKEVFEWVIDDSELVITLQEENSGSVVEVTTESEPDLVAKQNVPVKKSKPATRKNDAGESTSIRVGIDKIDNLINMVGELVITQSMLGQLGTDFDVARLPSLLEGLGQLEQNTRELQESVMRIRMLPISFAFSRFPRMVRDLSQKLNKSVDLVMLGEQTELDKTVMEKIGDPLVHLVRNAVDHGIELPQDRVAAGKRETGTVTLNAYHQGGNVVIEIQDDGKGLDKQGLVEKAVDKGILQESEASTISDEAAYDLIFHPGFSTAKAVSDVSGRGVGMDVVKKNIQALNGVVELTSKQGFGSTITIRLPLTLAILDGQLVRVKDNIYVFPLVSIVESMQYRREQISQIAGGCDVFRLRDDYVPIVKLHDVFGVPSRYEDQNALMVVVENDGEKVGVVIDELQAQQQVVIKSLEQNYKRVTGVSGATILGDGTVALILDIPGIVKLAGDNFKHAQQYIADQQLSA